MNQYALSQVRVRASRLYHTTLIHKHSTQVKVSVLRRITSSAPYGQYRLHAAVESGVRCLYVCTFNIRQQIRRRRWRSHATAIVSYTRLPELRCCRCRHSLHVYCVYELVCVCVWLYRCSFTLLIVPSAFACKRISTRRNATQPCDTIRNEWLANSRILAV